MTYEETMKVLETFDAQELLSPYEYRDIIVFENICFSIRFLHRSANLDADAIEDFVTMIL